MDKTFGNRRGWIIPFALAIVDAAIIPDGMRDK